MGSHRHLRFPSMSFIYKCSFRKPEWCFCFSRFGEESFFASTVTRLKPALSVFSIAIELKLIIACKGTDNKLVSQDGFHRTLTLLKYYYSSVVKNQFHYFFLLIKQTGIIEDTLLHSDVWIRIELYDDYFPILIYSNIPSHQVKHR